VCAVNRQFGENREVIRWRAVGDGASEVSEEVYKNKHQVENLILVVS